MAIALVQSKILSVGTSAAPALAFASNTTSGNTIVVCVSWASSSGSVTNVRDNVDGAVNYTLAKLVQGNGKSVAIYYLNNITGGTTPTVTATLNASQSFTAISIYEFSGLSGVVDVTGGNTGTATTSPTSGSITTTNANDLVLGAFLGQAASAGEAGWTVLLSSTLSSEFLIASSTGSFAATWTTASGAYSAAIVAFKAATAGAQIISPSGIPTTIALGTPALSPGPVSVLPVGIPSTIALGTPALAPGPVSISPTGIPSTIALGTPALHPGPVIIAPVGIPSTIALGTPSLHPVAVAISPTGIASSIALGLPRLSESGGVGVYSDPLLVGYALSAAPLASGDIRNLISAVGSIGSQTKISSAIRSNRVN